jgi:hypothetical protein
MGFTEMWTCKSSAVIWILGTQSAVAGDMEGILDILERMVITSDQTRYQTRPITPDIPPAE